MKKYILTLIVTAFFGWEVMNAQWKAEISPTNENLNAITATISGSLWIVGDMGTILCKKESDWLTFPKPTTEDLYSLDFISEKNAWAVGSKGTILHFDGNKWESVTSPTRNDLYSVKFKDRDNGVAVGKLGTLVIYKNGTWIEIKNGSKGNYNATYYLDEIWIGGGLECLNFPIIRVENSRSDAPVLVKNANFYASINSLFFLNAKNGWAVGSPSTLMHYDGSSWKNQFITEKFSSLNSIFFLDEETGICVGYNGTILRYSNESWTKDFSGVSQNLKSTLIHGNNCYAVGEYGTILSRQLNLLTDHSNTGDLSSVPELGSGIAQHTDNITENGILSVSLYPNPCNEILNVKLTSENTLEKGIIIVTNMDGKVMLEQKINFRETSSNFLIDTETLESGIYFLKIIIGENQSSSKFVVTH
jgi:photosystem II stability/assembly factor-like uncharacterized protein